MTETESARDNRQWRVEVSKACISSGICLAVAPDHFEFVGVRARPKAGLVHSAEDAELLMDAADDCPIGAISVVEE
ncbi:ferredoxin [Nocardia sp. BSTN01]|uniref:ferredoxin n=1 Tax=Nocardia sp. BSTN01 TaxID=2783665 RepID=UPI00188EB60E|nr:ferredoxin [Nocardia sp. BSTN01]MBF4998065.1 ferredoxin [Nocardia sp. BSTN01]